MEKAITESKRLLIKAHIKKEVKDFRKEITKLAIENKYPYVIAILEEASDRMKELIIAGKCDCRGSNESFLSTYESD